MADIEKVHQNIKDGGDLPPEPSEAISDPFKSAAEYETSAQIQDYDDVFNPDELDNILPSDAYQNEVDSLTAAGAAMDLSARFTPINTISQWSAYRKLGEKPGRLYQPEELNEIYKDSPKKFSRPMKLEQADFLHNLRREEAEWSRIVSKGPQGGFYTGVNIVAGLIPHAIDPINITASYGAVGAFNYARAIGPLTAVGRFKNGAQIYRNMSLNGRLMSDVASGFVGNIAVEPIILAGQKEIGADYTVEDAFFNATVGAVIFPGIRYIGNKFVDFSMKRSPHNAEIMHRTTVASLTKDKMPSVDDIIAMHAREGNSVKAPLRSLEIPTSNVQNGVRLNTELSQTTVYFSSLKANGIPTDGVAKISPLDIGATMDGSLQSSLANRLGVDPHGGAVGQVTPGRIKNGPVIDLEEAITLPSERDVFLKFAKKHFPKRDLERFRRDIVKGMTFEEAFERINGLKREQKVNQNAVEEINQVFHSKGIWHRKKSCVHGIRYSQHRV
jgi:hypothetical protein